MLYNYTPMKQTTKRAIVVNIVRLFLHASLLIILDFVISILLSSPTRHPPALPPSTQPPLPVPYLPLRQPSPSGQEAPAEDGGSGHHGQGLFGREVKMSILVHILLKRAFFSRWPEPDSFRREQESSGGRLSPPLGSQGGGLWG